MSKLRIYKASAGSGKTFRLAIEYLKIALSNDWNYKHILAVTFTNKATTEMKHRVVDELHKLSMGQQTSYLDVLKEEMNLTDIEISKRAKACLKNILHDYSRFSISTIDSFFQRVIKAFNRELGINTAYQVDLDDAQILDEAVDELLLSIDDDRDLLEWLKQFARDKIQEGGGWNLKGDILKLGRQIYNETFKELNQTLHEKLNDKKFIRDYRSQLQQIIFQFESKLKQIGQDGINIIEGAGFTVSDFKYGNSGAANSFYKMIKGDLTVGKRLQSAVEDASTLYSSPDKKGIEPIAHKIHPLLVEGVNFYKNGLSKYNTAKLIVNQLYTLGILVDLQDMVRKVTREKGVILLSESGTLLKQIIADSETPFVYEKTGVYFHHFMIDEFQDTSGQQWDNFNPLIANSLSENNLGMLVGDVKQAIYRWRNGDWNLLASKVSQAFPANGTTEETLTNNWRSSGEIIRFNNRIFQLVPEIMQKHFNAEMEEDGRELPLNEQIQDIYKESVQKIGKLENKDVGYVRMRFLEKKKTDEEVENLVLDDLIAQIKRVQDEGASANEIAVLVRKKDHAKLVADCLLAEKAKNDGQYNFNVLSSESLYVKNAPSVIFVLSLLSLLIDPADKLALALANYQYYEKIKPRLEEIGKQVQFLQFVGKEQLNFDFREPYTPNISSQFEAYDEEENQLFRFINSSFFYEILGSRNLQEVIFKLCEIFHLFELKDELAYLQAFIDQVSHFIKNRTTDISAFISWWEDEGQKKTVSVSEKLNAIRIQTIHKAKGLEYSYVFIPFCDWSLDVSAQHAPILWCKPSEEPFNMLELVPVKYAKSMGSSSFFKEYFTEKMSNYIDNLNLLYVAFTRAKHAIFTWSEYGNKLNSIGDLLKMSVAQDENYSRLGADQLTAKLLDSYCEDENVLEIGHLQLAPVEKEKGDEKKDVALQLNKYKFSDFSNYLKLRKNHENYFEDGKTTEKSINKGKLIHEILAKINTVGDLDKAVNHLVFQGLMTDGEAGDIKSHLKELITDHEVKSWFDGTYRVVNERNIITRSKELKRPDRIMIADDQVIVVDYKSGEKELDKYVGQVRNYMRELKACGYPHVFGYIWYTRNNKRVAVQL